MVRTIHLNDVKEIFDGAIALPLEERTAYLDAVCALAAVRKRVEGMLAADERADWLPASTRAESAGLFEALAVETIPDRFGRYAVRRRIATGGMGAVYEGVQDEPRRVVAIKVMRRNLVQQSSKRRFREEAQILGRLRHPAIAQIFDAAVHRGDGDEVPYFVMELVPGARSITRYVRERELGVRDRIALFIRVCEGVHHGHQKGVVHRDLKPDNILVDGSGQPKIIDFGVARATDADVAVTTMRTDVGQLVGTLQYMSPEQLEGDPRDLDTRSDVYALGVVLFELLTGETPQDIRGLSVPEALRVLRETRPARLSSVQPKLRGDLETIVKKTLERDRDRRYQSALELAQDLGRYLTGEAIAARPPSLVYHLRVAARRHRPAAIALASVLVVIATAAAVASGLYLQAETARKETAAERDNVATARDQARATESFLASMLTAVAPESPEDEIAYREILDAASRMIMAGDLDEQPLTEASVRRILARAYRSQRLLAEALPHQEAVVELYRATLGPEARATLEAKMDFTTTMVGLDRYPEVGELAERTLATCRRVLPPDDRLILKGVLTWAFAQQTLEGWRQAMEARIAFDGPDSGSAHFGMHVYGMSLSGRADQPMEGRRYQERALEFFHGGRSADGTLGWGEQESRAFLSRTYRILGLFERAEAVLEPLRPTIEESRRSDRRLGHFLFRLFWEQSRSLVGQGRLDEAETLLRPDLERSRRTLGDGHWITAHLARTLADVLRETGRHDEAMDIALDDTRFKDITPDEVVYLATHRARILLDAGLPMRAEVESRKALADVAAFGGKAETWLVAAEVFYTRGLHAEAIGQLELAMSFYDEKCEPVHPARARTRRLLGAILADEGDVDAAEAALRDALALDLEWRGPDDRETGKSRLALGRFLAASGRSDDARAELDEARRMFASSPFDEGLWLPRVEAAAVIVHKGEGS